MSALHYQYNKYLYSMIPYILFGEMNFPTPMSLRLRCEKMHINYQYVNLQCMKANILPSWIPYLLFGEMNHPTPMSLRLRCEKMHIIYVIYVYII